MYHLVTQILLCLVPSCHPAPERRKTMGRKSNPWLLWSKQALKPLRHRLVGIRQQVLINMKPKVFTSNVKLLLVRASVSINWFKISRSRPFSLKPKFGDDALNLVAKLWRKTLTASTQRTPAHASWSQCFESLQACIYKSVNTGQFLNSLVAKSIVKFFMLMLVFPF